MIASHFGRPRGLIGRLVGRIMARSNGDFNRWVVEQLAKNSPDQPARIVELGPGPGGWARGSAPCLSKRARLGG